MATQARRAPRAKPKEKFFILCSDCGDTDQLETYDNVAYESEAAAKKSTEGDEYSGTLFVVKVVATGASRGFTWN